MPEFNYDDVTEYSLDPDLLEPLARLFEIDGGDLQVTHGQLLFRLPSLAAARAAGR